MTWLSSDAAPAALLDELSKIGSAAEGESNKERILRALKTIGIAGAGIGLGSAASAGLQGKLPWLNRLVRAKPPITGRKRQAIRIGLPIAGGLAAMLGSKYRKKVDEGLSAKTPNDVS